MPFNYVRRNYPYPWSEVLEQTPSHLLDVCMIPECDVAVRGIDTQVCQYHWNATARRTHLPDGQEGPPVPRYREIMDSDRRLRWWQYHLMYRPGRDNEFICMHCAARQYWDVRDVPMTVTDAADQFPLMLFGVNTEDCVRCSLCENNRRIQCISHVDDHYCQCPINNSDCGDCHNTFECYGHCDYDCECSDPDCCERPPADGSCHWCGTDDCQQSTAPWCDGSTFTVTLTQHNSTTP
jgi:hypothetical protein